MKSYNGKTKFIIVTGGVVSGLGKGVAAASIGASLTDELKVVPVKCDGYLNSDPGTMNPVEHGEVFVLDDGGEVDMDFGHYERYLNITTKFNWNLTMGKMFKEILEKERRGEFLGKTVQFIPHLTDLIKSKFYEIAEQEKADVLLIEVGGTVGDLENQFYLEAVRQLKHDVGSENTLYVHLTYVPIPGGVDEQKSKPSQMSIKSLNVTGIYPDVVIGRSPKKLTNVIKEKIALFGNIDADSVISGVDVKNVYEIPLNFVNEGISSIIHKKLGINVAPNFTEWNRLVSVINENLENPRKTINVAICGKYITLEDSYASVVESLTHSGAHLDLKVKVHWVDTEAIELGQDVDTTLRGIDAVIIPGGFGTRGIEGKIQVIRYARENKIPFLGICYGMQLAVVEYARNVCGMTGAGTTEIEADGGKVEIPVIDILPWQKEIKNKGATMRLGGQDVLISKGTLAEEVYGSTAIRERFRHRYEVNPEFVDKLESDGNLVFSGKASKENIMQIMELKNHPYFIAGQFHPELKSTLLNPAPLFYGLLKAANESK